MTTQQTRDRTGLRLAPPPPKGFDPLSATEDDLSRHGLPSRPNPRTQPGAAALWEQKARRYRDFEHLEPQVDTSKAGNRRVTTAAIGPDPIDSCGFSLLSTDAPFTILFITWTVPDLQFQPSPSGVNHFHTFAGLGFLDVHVEMTVDEANKVTSQLWAQDVGQINLAVRRGDVLSASLCLDIKPPGTAHYFLTNETRKQMMNFTLDSGFPPAVTVDAGVTRDDPNQQFPALARFGSVYFDEISAYTTAGRRSLTSGDAITMVDGHGGTLAKPSVLTDYAFKVLYTGP